MRIVTTKARFALYTSSGTALLFSLKTLSAHQYPSKNTNSRNDSILPPDLLLSVLSRETHLLVDNQLSAHRVESSSDSDSDDDSYVSVSFYSK